MSVPDPLHRGARRPVPRRRLLAGLAASAAMVPAGAHAFRLFNPCLDAELPEPLASREIVADALEGIAPSQVIDTHVADRTNNRSKRDGCEVRLVAGAFVGSGQRRAMSRLRM